MMMLDPPKGGPNPPQGNIDIFISKPSPKKIVERGVPGVAGAYGLMPTTFILKFSPHKTFHLTSFIFSTFYVSSLFIMYSHHHTHLHATLSIIFCIILPPILYSLSFKSISCHLLRFLPTQNHTSLHITSPHTFLTYCTSFIFTLHHLIHCITSSIALPHPLHYLIHFVIQPTLIQ